MTAGPWASAPIDTLLASLGRRLAVSLYEALLLGALGLAIGFVLLPLVGPDAATASGDQRLPLPNRGARAISFACLFLVYGAYGIWLWSDGRRSLPMRTWRIDLRTAAGGIVSPWRAAVRYLACWIGPAVAIAAYLALRPHGHRRWAAAMLALNYAWALIDPDRQFLHDRLAGTRLVRDAALRRTADAEVIAPPSS